MERRPRLTVLAAVVAALALLFSSAPARADKATEGAARSLQKKAMDEDYLNVDFDKAAEHLNQAIAKCGASACSANLRALLRRDLATVFSAANKKDEALATMIDALKTDGTIQLDPNFKTKEIEAVYAAAKKGAGSGGGGATPPPSTGGGGGPPTGDFTHSPASEQAIRTPLPIYVEYGGSEAVTKIVVKYKGFGMTEFKTLELKKHGSGWGANIPCADIQQGDIVYYLQGFNSNNDPVATGGDRNNPYKTTISKTISGDGPHLPGDKPLAQCADTGDCPPDFPGCNKKVAADTDLLKGQGEDCEEDSQCKSGTCKDDHCTKPPDTDVSSTGTKLRHFWIGLAVSLDLQFLPGAKDACVLNGVAQPGNPDYQCVQNGNDYPARHAGLQNADILIGQSDQVNGGMLPANLRILLAFDYALNYNLLLGARIGYTAMDYPGQAFSEFPPLHLEARGTYVFGKEALVTKGLAPVLLLAGGAAQFSSQVGVVTEECDLSNGKPAGTYIQQMGKTPQTSTAVKDNGGAGTGVAQKGQACVLGTKTAQSVQAWRVAGPVFVAPGAGLRYTISDRAALSLNLKLALVFGNGFMFDPTPELAFQYGF